MSSGRLTLRARLAASIHPISGRPASPDRGEDRVLRAQRCEMSAADGRVSRSTRTCVPPPLPDPCPEPRRRDNVDRFPSRHPCDGRRPRRCREAPPGLPRRPPGPVEPASGRRVRHVRAPRLVAVDHLQRRPHRRHLPGDRRVPHQGRHGRAAVRRRRHARALRARVADLRRGPGGERRRRAGRRGGRLHPHPGGVARDPRPQPQPRRRHRGRHRDHALPQPSAGRRLQVQPAERGARRHGRHEVDRGAGERAARGEAGRGAATVGRPARSWARTTSSAVTSTTCPRW